MRPIIVAAAVLLVSCYYESTFPIGTPEEARVDPALIGVWRGISGDAKDDVVRVSAFDERTYAVELDSKGEHDLLRAFIGELGHARFINVQSVYENERRYLPFRYDWAGDTLVLRGIKEGGPPPLASQATLRKWVWERIDRADIYSEPIKLKRD